MGVGGSLRGALASQICGRVETSAFLTNTQSQFASVVPNFSSAEISAPSSTHLTSLYLSGVLEAMFASRLRALEGRRVTSKCPSSVKETKTRELLEGKMRGH